MVNEPTYDAPGYTRDEAHLIDIATEGSFGPEHAAPWLALCRRLFEARYLRVPDGPSKLNAGDLWENLWKCLPPKNTLNVVTSPAIQKIGMIEVPEEWQRIRCCGWVLSVSPQMFNERCRAKMANPPLFELDPLDYVGRAFMWLHTPGPGLTPMGDARGTRRSEYFNVRADDLIQHLLTIE